MTDTAAAGMTLRVVRQSATDPVSSAYEVTVADRAAAARYLGYYRDDVDAISAFLTDADGHFAGSGVAGGGRVCSDWA